jgi:hypothetical protein
MHLPGGTEEHHENSSHYNPSPGCQTFRMRSRSAVVFGCLEDNDPELNRPSNCTTSNNFKPLIVKPLFPSVSYIFTFSFGTN